jgi:hypothetical protein
LDRRKQIQHTRYHSPPPEGNKRDGYIGRVSIWIEQLEELDQEAKRVWQHTEAGNEETPEVQAMITLEGNQNQDDEFDCVIQSQTKEYGDDDFEGEGIAGVTCILVNYRYGRRKRAKQTSSNTSTCRKQSTLRWRWFFGESGISRTRYYTHGE